MQLEIKREIVYKNIIHDMDMPIEREAKLVGGDVFINTYKDDLYYIHTPGTLDVKLNYIRNNLMSSIMFCDHPQVIISQLYDFLMGGASLALGSFATGISNNGQIYTIDEYLRNRNTDRQYSKVQAKKSEIKEYKKEVQEKMREEKRQQDLASQLAMRKAQDKENNIRREREMSLMRTELETEIKKKYQRKSKEQLRSKTLNQNSQMMLKNKSEQDNREIDAFLDDLIEKNSKLPPANKIKLTYATVCRITEMSLMYSKLKAKINNGDHPFYFPTINISTVNADQSIRNFHVGVFQETVNKIGKLRIKWVKDAG